MTKTKAQKQRAAFANKVANDLKVKLTNRPKAKKGNNPPSNARSRPNNMSRSAPAAIGFQAKKKLETMHATRNKQFPGSVCIRGQELLQGVAVTGASTGTNMVNLSVNPNNFTGTRLAEYGKLYDKFLFTRLRITFASGMATSSAGQYILAYDRDFADTTPPATSAGLQQYYSMMDSKISNAWESSTMVCTLADFQDFYYNNNTGYDGRLVYQGQIYMAAVSGTTFTGSVLLDYECEFYDPQLETADTQFISNDTTASTIPDTNTSLFKNMTVTYGQPISSSAETIKPHFWDDASGFRWVSLPPGNWVIDFVQILSNSVVQSISGVSLQAFLLNAAALAARTVLEDVYSELNVSHPVNRTSSTTTTGGSSAFNVHRFVFSIPQRVGRVVVSLLATTITQTLNNALRTLSVYPISSARLAIADLEKVHTKSLTSVRFRIEPPSVETSPLIREESSTVLSAVADSSQLDEGEDDDEDGPIIDPGQLELYKQFVRLQISKTKV